MMKLKYCITPTDLFSTIVVVSSPEPKVIGELIAY